MEQLHTESSPRRAIRDTITAQKTVPFMWGGELVLAGAGGAWLAATAPEGASVAEQVGRTVGGGLLGLVIAVLIIFAWNLVLAPYHQRDEARKKIKSQRSERRTASILTELAELRTQGVGLRNEAEEQWDIDLDAAKWWEEVERWKLRVESTMRQLHPSDPEKWSTLDRYNLLAHVPSHVQREVSMLSAWLLKLDDYITRRRG